METIALAAVLILFLVFTDPNRISLPLILVPYLLASLIIYRSVNLILFGLFAGTAKKSKIRLYSLIITAVTVNFALLKSIGQITVQDFLISGAIVVVSVIYISRFSLSK